MDAASDHEVEESKEVAAHTNEPHAPTEEPVQEGGAKGKRLTFGAGLLVKRPSRIEVFKKLMSTEVLRSTVRKHITTNRLLDASTKMKNEGTNVRSDSFTARLFCQENGEEHIVAWKRTGSFVRLKELVCNMFQFEDCDLFDVERHLRLNSDSEISLMVDEWSEREAARKQDILATWLLEVQQQLTDQEPDLALHALWELACRPENHSDVSVDLIEQVVSTMLDCTHEKKHHRIAAMAAAALWMLAEPETTRNTFPLEMCVPALIQTATKIFECKEHSDLTLHPIGALGCLLRVPEAVPLFDQAGGTAMLMPTLTSQSAQVRRVATATLYFVTTLSENACLTIASTGGLPKLAEVSLNKGESTALRASALLALGCCVKRTAEVLTASDEADGAARLGQGFKLPPQLLEHLTTFGSALMNSIDATSDTGVAHNEPIGDRDSLDVLLGVVLNTMWNVLVLLYTSPLPPEMVPRRDALTGAAAFLKRVLESNLNYLCICPACGALNNIPKYVASSNVSIALLQKLPFIHGRTLEAGATLLAQVVQKKSECDLFMQAGGADAVLVRMVRLIEESRAAENAADDEMHSLQGSAMRAHAALSFALMTAVCAAARVIVFDPSMEDGELPPLPRDEGNAEHPRRSRRRRSVLAAPDQTQPKAQKVGGSSGVPVREDHHRIAEWFVKLDENNDGFVTREELISVVLEHGGTKEQAMSICEELDGNNDGTISLFELCDAYGVRMPLLRAGSFELLVNASAVAQTRSLCYLMVAMWTLATFSNCRAPLGKAQGVEAALRALKRAMNEHEQEPVGSQGSATRLWCLKAAQWACAALWLLCYDDDNAIRLLELSVDLIVHLARNGEPTLRFMAMGCVVRLVLLPTTMNTMIMDYKATELLRKVGHDRNASDRLRLMCTTTLGFLTRSDGSVDASISEQVGRSCGMESILKNLILSEGQVGLQTVGCRRLALFAMQGRRKCRSALEAGATQAVVDLLRKRVKPKGVGSERGDMSAGSLGELWCLKEPELLRVAINALLNLSVEPENQKHLTRSALSIVMELLTSSELEDTSEDKQMLVQILENLSTNDENRRHLYKAELVLRTLQFQSAMHSSANGIEQSTVNDSALLPPIHGDGALTSRSDPGFKSSSASQSSPRRATAADSVKQQYVDWLNSVFDDVTLQEKDDSGGQAAKVALARMHHGEPALATPRRAKKEVSEVQRVEGGTGLLPRLMCQPMGTTWRQHFEGIHGRADGGNSPHPPNSPRGRSPLRSTRARKVMGTDRSSPPRGEVSYMSDDESKNGLDIISSLLGGQKPSEVRNIPSQSHDPWHPPIEKIEVRNIQKTGPPESTRSRRYKCKKEKLKFTVTLNVPPGQDESCEPRSYRFNQNTQAGSDSGDERKRSSMTAWKGIQGARYWEGLFSSVPLAPNSKTVMRFYHSTTHLYSQHPGSEPGEEEPCSLADVQQTLPPPLPTIKPTAKDQPRLRHFIYPGAPPPLKHTLKGVRHHDVWMGTIPFSMIDIRVAAKKKMNMDLVEFKADASQVVQSSRSWNIDQSCFRHRKELSDSRSYWDTPTVYKRGFEMDWARINSERFSSVVLPYKLERDGESRRAALDMARLRDAIDAHKEMLYSMFSYYSVSTGQRGDRLSCWSMAKFVRFVDECNLVDPNSESCRLVDLENAFIASMQMAKMQTSIAIGTSFKGDSQNYLYRFGFIGCMVRIAALKYPQERQYSLCWAFQRLVCDCLKREAPELAFIDRDIFRTAKLYSPETEDVLIKYSQSLKALYDFYGGSEDETGQRTTMRLEEWQQMLGDAEMIDSVFTRREAAFCFAFSQLFVADEVKRREMLLGIDYISFCEALARITCWKPIPTDSFLKERGASNVVDCIDTLIAQHKYGEWCTQNAPNWAVEQEDGRHLDEVFEKLLQLLVARLDVEGAGYLSAKSFRNLTRTPGASKYLQ